MNPNHKGRIVLAAGTGFLGKLLRRHLTDQGYEIIILTRSPSNPGEIKWDGRTIGPWAAELEDALALINLAGKSVNCRYNERNRKLIMDSRVESTRVLGEAIGHCHQPPPLWLNASTATIYKHSVTQETDEDSTDFSATPQARDAFSVSVAQNWEKTFYAASTPNTRKVALRISMVLGTEEGTVFRVLSRLTRLGLGGRMGSGNQYVSWIHESDFCHAIQRVLEDQNFQGAVNLTSPNPLPNREMMRILRRVCRRPIGLLATEWMLEFGAFFMRTETELILKSRRVVPRRLLDAGFNFAFPNFESAAEDLTAKLKT